MSKIVIQTSCKSLRLQIAFNLTNYLRGEADLERDRAILRTRERLRLRPTGDLLGGLRARLGGGELPKY